MASLAHDESAAVTPEIQALAAKLTVGKTSEREKAEALYQYVSTNIRYVSISFGIGRLQPHRAAEILKNGYGDCKDKHILFTALLKAAGIRAQAVLATPGLGIIVPDVPSPEQFNHEFTAIDLDGSRGYLDTTLGFAEPGVLMPGVRGKKALLVAEGKSQVIDVPEHSPIPEQTRSRLTGTISASGAFSGTNHVEARGIYAVFLRRLFQEGTEDQKQALLKQLAGLELNQASISKITNSDPKDLLRPFSLQYAIGIEAFGPAAGASKRVTLLTGNLIDTSQLAKAPKPQKPVPIPSEDATRSIDLSIDPVFTVVNSMPVHLKAPFGSYDSEFTFEQGHLHMIRAFKLDGKVIQPQDWTQAVDFLKGLVAEAANGFSLERKTAVGSSAASMNNPNTLEAARDALNRHDFAAAQKGFAAIVERNPQDGHAWDSLGFAYLNLHEFDKAEDALKRAIAIDPYEKFAYNNLGRVYLRRYEPDKAIVQFKKQLEVNPSDRFAHGNLAGALILEGKRQEAEKEAITANQIVPDNPAGWLFLGRAQAKLGKLDDARKSFDRALQASDNTVTQNSVAYQMADAGIELDRAWQLATSALTIQASEVCNPERLVKDESCTARLERLSATLDTAGWVLVKQGKCELARPYLDSSYAIAPRPASIVHRALVEAKVGKVEEAIRLYATARSMRGFNEADTKPIRDELTRDAGGDAAFTAKLDAALKAVSPPGAIPSPSVRTGETKEMAFEALVDPSGTIVEIQAQAGTQASQALLDDLKKLELPSLSWPGHQLRSIRTVRLRGAVATAYVASPRGENTPD